MENAPTICESFISFFKSDLFQTMLGAFLGFLAALLADRQIQKNTQRRRYREQMKYLIQLSNNALNTWSNQLNEFDSYAKELDEKPYTQNLLNRIGNKDIKRLSDVDCQELFQAYTSIMKNKTNKIEEYTSLYTSIDYLGLIYEQEVDACEKHVLQTYERQQSIKRCIDSCVILISQTFQTYFPEQSDKEIEAHHYGKFLLEICNNILSLQIKNTPVEDYLDLLILPYLKRTASYINFPNVAELQQYLTLANMEYYTQKINAEKQSKDVKKIREKTQSSVGKIQEIIKKIEDKISEE